MSNTMCELHVEFDHENGVFDIGDMDPYEGSAPEAGRVAEAGYRYGTGGHDRNIKITRVD